MSDQQERRNAVLTDADVARIETAFDKRLNSLFEMIGYDTTTPESRSSIRKDHEFVRSARRAKGKIVAAFLTAIGGSAAVAATSGDNSKIASFFSKLFGGGS